MLAGELLGRVRGELPVVGELGEREQVLVSAWLTGLRSARTRRAYAGDVVAWLGWLAGRETDVLAAGRVHVDLWAATQLDDGAAASSVRRRLSALSSFYRYCAAHDLTGWVPTQGVARPVVDPGYTATVSLDRDQARALVAAADADTGTQALRTAAVVRLLLHNALRVDEACAADVADLGEDCSHREPHWLRRSARDGGQLASVVRPKGPSLGPPSDITRRGGEQEMIASNAAQQAPDLASQIQTDGHAIV